MIVKDEEKNLADCLRGFAPLFDQVVVVDTGSTDRTKEIAREFAAEVHDFPWCDSFAAARNESLKYARGAWVTWVDADDRITADNQQKLRRLLAGLGDENAAYALKCQCLPDANGQGGVVVDHVRVFRNDPAVRWEFRVHEQILPAVKRAGGTCRFADVTIHHVGYVDPALRRRKLERDLRLLHLERQELGDHPFTLFNLGQSFHELGRHRDALDVLRRCLARCEPGASIERKVYALLVQCHDGMGAAAEALAACREGLRHYPEDVELAFREGLLHKRRRDPRAAKEALGRCLASREGPHLASVHPGIRGFLARHHLAEVHEDLGEFREAEARWREALAEAPRLAAGWDGLGHLLLRQGRWAEVEEVAARLDRAGGLEQAQVLRAEAHLRRKEYDEARRLLEGVITGAPKAVRPREVLTHVLLQAEEWGAAERALRAVLELDPGRAEVRRNLGILLRDQGRKEAAGKLLYPDTLEGLYRRACWTPSAVNEVLPALYHLARGCAHVTEFGTGAGNVTAALLYAQPGRLVTYDKVRTPEADRLKPLAGQTEFVFRQENVLKAKVEATDLLVIDTWKVAEQLREELRRHGKRVRRCVAVLGTAAYGEEGEAPGHKGLGPALAEFVAQGGFRVKEEHPHGHGLTVLEAVTPGETA